MFRRLEANEPLPGWPGGKAFEYLVLRAFELEGAEVTWPFSVRRNGEVLEQLDGAVQDIGLFCLLEMKHYRENIDIEAIARMRGRLARRPAQTMGAIFSMRGFTPAARLLSQYTSPPNVLLWDEGRD